MRDEVFRVPGSHGSRPRWIELDGECWYLLSDVFSLRGYSAQLARLPEVLGRIPEDEADRVWVLEPGLTHPSARWVVSAEGRSAVYDMYPQKQGRKRRTASRGATATDAAGVPGATAQRD